MSAIVAMTTQVCGRSVRCCVQSSDVSIQKKISGYFGRFRPLYPGSSDQIEVVSSSDDDAPLVSQHVAATGPAKKKRRLAARDGAAVVLPVEITILMLQAGSDARLKEKLKKVLRLMTTTISTVMTVL